MKDVRILVNVVFGLLALLPSLRGQSVTGQISGTVVDPTGGIIAGAEVRLTHNLSRQVRTSTKWRERNRAYATNPAVI